MKTVSEDGVFYTLNAQYHREDGPAVEWADGTKKWYINGKRHREDGPAVEWANGNKSWFINGKQLAEEEFNKRPIRTVDEYGSICYKLNDKYHREDCPAIEHVNGNKYWYINGNRHRKDGPAIEADSTKQWYINGLRHREDGPAAEYANGDKFWYINGKELTEKEFNNRTIKTEPKEYITKLMKAAYIAGYEGTMDLMDDEIETIMEMQNGRPAD